jgi:E3 ubiquitin-protein ligase DOA10
MNHFLLIFSTYETPLESQCYFGGFNSGRDVDGQQATLQCLCSRGFLGQVSHLNPSVAGLGGAPLAVYYVSYFPFFLFFAFPQACEQMGLAAAYNTVRDEALNYGPFGMISWFQFLLISFLACILLLLLVVFWEPLALKSTGCYYYLTDGLMSTQSVQYQPIPTREIDM